MDDQVRPLSSNGIGLAILFAALIVSLPSMVAIKEAGWFEDAFNDRDFGPTVAMSIGTFCIVAIAMAFGMPLALKRLRDPRLGYGDWTVTGAAGGLLGAILLNLLIVAAVLLGPSPLRPDESLGVVIVSIFGLSGLAGAAIGALARAIALQLHTRNRG